MNYTTLTADFFNKSISCRFDDITYVFTTVEKFVELTGYPYSDTTLFLSYEPIRNIFSVERIGGVYESGETIDEISWIVSNLDVIKQAAISNEAERQASMPTVTLAMVRDGMLYTTDWVLQRYQEETLLNLPHTITDAQLTAVLEYRQQLRDITKTYSSIDTVVWPTNPLA